MISSSISRTVNTCLILILLVSLVSTTMASSSSSSSSEDDNPFAEMIGGEDNALIARWLVKSHHGGH